MIRVALTGGIGSGKTTVAKLFELLGVPVYYSDLEAKKLVLKNKSVRKAIIKSFGEQSYLPDNSYNTKYISSIVFNDKKKLSELNAIIHPAVFEHQREWFQKQNCTYAIVESALLFETNNHTHYDKIIVVQTDDHLRIQRIIQRDHISKEMVLKRFENQLPQEHKVALADFVVYNNSEPLIPQITYIHKTLLNLPSKHF